MEDCLFRVPREPLEAESTVFRDMFLLPQGETVEGLTDANPVVLPGVSKEDFEQLLKALMCRSVITLIRMKGSSLETRVEDTRKIRVSPSTRHNGHLSSN